MGGDGAVREEGEKGREEGEERGSRGAGQGMWRREKMKCNWGCVFAGREGLREGVACRDAGKGGQLRTLLDSLVGNLILQGSCKTSTSGTKRSNSKCSDKDISST